MATITVRIDDDVRDSLQILADEKSVTLSEFVRDRLEEAVVRVSDERPEVGPEYSPDSLSAMDRHQLALLHRILARVLPADSNDVDGDRDYQLERASVLEKGFTQEYWAEFAGLRPELTRRDCQFVMDVLDLFRITDYSISALDKEAGAVSDDLRRSLTYRGFDHNDRLEGAMSDFVEYLIDSDRWTERESFVKGSDRGNSHRQMVSTYSRMLTAYRQIKQRRPRRMDLDSFLLNMEELIEISEARVHPSHRPR